MWRPDRSLRGPERPTLRDIDPLNRVFADAFTDLLDGIRAKRAQVMAA